MKERNTGLIGFLAVLLVIVVTLWLRRVSTGGTLDMKFSGPSGCTFTGYLVKDGKRVPYSGLLPDSLHSAGITEFEFRKARIEDTVNFSIYYDEAYVHSSQINEIGPGVLGIRGWVRDHGLSIESFRQ